MLQFAGQQRFLQTCGSDFKSGTSVANGGGSGIPGPFTFHELRGARLRYGAHGQAMTLCQLIEYDRVLANSVMHLFGTSSQSEQLFKTAQ